MENTNDDVVLSLKKIGKGSVYILLGMFFYYFSVFLFRLFLARSLPVSEYGEIMFGITFSSIGATLASLGIANALPREIAYDRKNARTLAIAGLLLTLFSSLILLFILYPLSPYIPLIFTGVDSQIFLIFSILILFIALLQISVSIGRGFEDVKQAFWFRYLLPGVGLLILGYLSLYSLKNPIEISLFYLLILGISSLLSVLYLLLKRYLSFTLPSREVYIHLLMFSVPLVLSAFIWSLFSRTDVFVLGYFLNSAAVGLYSAALSIVQVIPFFLVALNYLYLPIASSFLSNKKIESLRRLYQIITKWITVLTVPIFFITMMFPGVVINIFFGPRYLTAVIPLLILSVAFSIHTSLGANGLTVLAFGDSRYIFKVSFIGAVSNLVLNILFVPIWGLAGAALATGLSLVLINLLYSLYLYKRYRMHPFTRKYFLPIVISFFLLVPLKFVSLPSNYFVLILTLIVYLLLYGLLLFLFRIYDKEDAQVLKLLAKKLGIRVPAFLYRSS